MNLKSGRWAKKPCQNCGEETTNVKFCSNSCQQDYQVKEIQAEIERTGEIPSRRSGIKYLKMTRGNKCEICGIEQWEGKSITMVMDHIDGNASNNTLPNLRLICPNCDSQLPTYKSRNRGKGRYSRRVRYAQGKSY